MVMVGQHARLVLRLFAAIEVSLKFLGKQSTCPHSHCGRRTDEKGLLAR
ncbi:hypothetical protein BBOMB_0510 [Bifidobacterium bombi DSM 19703]|uniref:Uncharacterized protein n=1 Tax=Bifidobacterium bombi DSM 19703 TaxID=1341695 RepID=A0A080N2R9_9BIFI|nr:hypothetical protein BBOMB_0510 [Bifidobacterium bombi DSM 19703]